MTNDKTIARSDPRDGGSAFPRPVQRDLTIDTAKGLGILLVIFGHVCHLHPYWSIIYSFHMPLFFLIAGMNYHAEKYPRLLTLLKKRFRTMILPYLFFCLFGIGINLVFQLLKGSSLHEIGDYLIQLPYAIVWMPYSKYAQLFNTPLWFVPCLVLLEVMFFFINRIRKQWLFWLAVLTVTACGWWMESEYAPIDFTFLPWNFSTACFAVSFFAVGNRAGPFLKKQITWPEPSLRRGAVLALAFAAAFVVTGYVGAHNSGSFGSRVLNNGFLFILTGMTGTLCVLIGAHFLRYVRVLRFFGKNSFAVMGFQIPLYWAVASSLRLLHASVSDRIPIYSEDSVLHCILMFLLIALLSALFTLLYNQCRGRIFRNSSNVQAA